MLIVDIRVYLDWLVTFCLTSHSKYLRFIGEGLHFFYLPRRVTRWLWKGDDHQQQTTGTLWSESSIDHSPQVRQSIMLKFYMMLHWTNRYSITAPAARKKGRKLYDATVKIKDFDWMSLKLLLVWRLSPFVTERPTAMVQWGFIIHS